LRFWSGLPLAARADAKTVMVYYMPGYVAKRTATTWVALDDGSLSSDAVNVSASGKSLVVFPLIGPTIR